jgi:hypothetical protein
VARPVRATVAGYALTVVCVPLPALAPLLGAAGVAATLVLLERVGRAVRSPARSALLARMAVTAGCGRGRSLRVVVYEQRVLVAGAGGGRPWPVDAQRLPRPSGELGPWAPDTSPGAGPLRREGCLRARY